MKLKLSTGIFMLGMASAASAGTVGTGIGIGPMSVDEFDVGAVVSKVAGSVVTVSVTSSDAEASDVSSSEGAGIIVSDKGYILTVAHLVGGASKIVVHLADGTAIDAVIAASSDAKDLALLKVDVHGLLPPASDRLTALVFGTSRPPDLGEPVVVIGDLHGLRNSVSLGIISGLNRQVTTLSGVMLQGVIQLGGAISPGNSGGPVLAANGDLIGLVFAACGGADSVAFAYPRWELDTFLARNLAPQ